MRWIRKDVTAKDGVIYFVPLGDFHCGAAEFTATAEEKLRGYLEWILEKPNAFTFLMGDLLNCATTSSAGRPFEEILGATDQFIKIKRLLEPLAHTGRVLGSLIGNHEYQLLKSTGSKLNRALELCEALGIDYAGAACYLSLNVSRSKTQRTTWDLFLSHGFGGGRRRGAKVNNLEQLALICEADVYCSGHVHDCLPFRAYRWSHNKNRLQRRKVAFTTSGSFLDYSQTDQDKPSEAYSERLAFAPVEIGAPRIRLSADENGKKDIHISI